MGVGFVVIIVLLAGLLGMFARQALANMDIEEEDNSSQGKPGHANLEESNDRLHVM